MTDHEIVKAQVKWIAEKVDRMDQKLDRLIQSHAFFKGKMIGMIIVLSGVISVVTALAAEMIRRNTCHTFMGNF